jgi:hypothetical protein
VSRGRADGASQQDLPTPAGQTGQPAPPAPTPVPPRRPLAAISPARYALYVAAAAALHGVVYYLQRNGLRIPAPPGETWIPHASMLVGMVAVRLFARHARPVAMVVAAVTTLAIARPSWAAALGAFLAVTWGIARLPLGPLARVGLVLLANAALPAARTLLGPSIAAWLAPGVATVLLPVLLLRSLLYQVEVSRLLLHERSFLCYLGSFATIPLAGGTYLQPITYRRFIGEYGAADAERTLRAGVGLLALGVLYLWLRPTAVTPWSGAVLQGLGQAAVRDALGPALEAAGRGPVALALVGVQVERYLTIAGLLFYLVGNLRLLGFNLASGYRYPFISRSFVDLWQRTNFYLRECQLVLYYVPVAKLLRRRVGRRVTAGVAATAAIAGHLAVAIVLNNLIVSGSTSNGARNLLLDAGRFAVIGLLTIASVLRPRRTDPAPVSWPRRVWQTAFVISLAVLNLAVWELMIVGLRWPQAVAVLKFVAAGTPP